MFMPVLPTLCFALRVSSEVNLNLQESYHLPSNSERDTKLPYLYLRHNKDGTATWNFYKWSRTESKPVRILIGRLSEWSRTAARVKAEELARALDGPQFIRERTGPTVAQAMEIYAANRSARGNRTTNWMEEAVNRCAPDWLDKRLGELKRDQIQKLHDHHAITIPTTAARLVKALRALLRASDLPNVAANIAIRGPNPRKRYLSVEEEARLLAALEGASSNLHDTVKLALYTGGRKSNVYAMRWDEINLAESEWKIPACKSKNGDAMTLPLHPVAMAIIKARQGWHDEWVFPSFSASGHVMDLHASWDELRRSVGLKDVTIHDLRRTFAVRLVEANVTLPVIAAALGHKSPHTTMTVYALAPNASVREAVLRARGT